MKQEKIYSGNSISGSLYYYRELEDNDIVGEDCFLKFCDSFTRIVPDSIWMGKTIKDIRKESPSGAVVIAKRFNNF